MKKVLLYLFVIVIVLSTFSCDRFKHHFDPVVTPFEQFLEHFATKVEDGILFDDVTSIMSYYSDTYLNNGMEKSDIENLYTSLAAASPDSVAIEIDILSEIDFKVSYRIVTGGVDTTIVDYAQAQRDSFLFIGDQVEPPVIQKILVEVSTGTSCVSCPYAEDAAKQLKETYGDQVCYIEYHMGDQFDPHSMNYYYFTYFGIFFIPQALFQGQVKVTGGGEDTYDEYVNTIGAFLNQVASAELKDFAYMASDSLRGTVMIEKDDDLPLENLYLKYALVEKVTSVVNHAGELCLQAVLRHNKIPIGDHDFSQPVEFALEIPQDVPEDTALYIWLQTFEDAYNPDTCKIYNVIEEDILFDKGSIK